MRFQILFSSLFIKIVAFAVNNDYKGHIFYVKLTESFCAQILVCDKLRFFDTFGKKGAGTADGSEVNTVIFFHGFYYFRQTRSFADHSAGSYRHHGWCVGIHTAAGSWSGRSDDLTWFCRSWSYIINSCICWIKRNLFAFCKSLTHTLVTCVTGCVDGSGKENLISCVKGFCQFFRQRQCNMSSFHDQITSVLWRVTWQLMLTAHGIPAM